jgi:hypothetical protein
MNRLAARVRVRGFGTGTAGAGAGGNFNPIPGLSPAAYFKFNTGITVTGSGVSQWSDQSGNGRHLLQATDANRPALQADGTILFDGAAHYLKCSAFTLNQPFTVYLCVKQVSWTLGRRLFDGSGSNTRMDQSGSTPAIAINAGSGLTASNSNLAVGAYGSVAVVFNGASSSIKVNATEETTGNPGAANAGGFTLGAAGSAAIFSNIQVKEAALFPAAHDAATRAAVIAYLNTL